MTENQKSQDGNINLQIEKIKKQIVEANNQIKKYVEKRDQLHQQARKSREEINQIKAERDALNEKVKLLKEQRNVVRAQATPIMEEVKAIDEKIAEIKKNVPRVNQHELQEELDAIEWKISTTTMDLQEEKRLVGEVKELELLLKGYKKIDKKNQKIKELITQRKTIDAKADVFHQELTDLAKKSQDLHSQMIEKVNAVKKDRAEADSLHQAFIKAKEQNALWYEQIKALMDQSRGIRIVNRQFDLAKRKEEDAKRQAEQAKWREEQAQRAVKEKEIKEKIGTEAKEKLNRGEKVNWEEFQLMLGNEEDDD
ncbi:MAG: coiled-coil protein [Bacillota bacterium]